MIKKANTQQYEHFFAHRNKKKEKNINIKAGKKVSMLIIF